MNPTEKSLANESEDHAREIARLAARDQRSRTIARQVLIPFGLGAAKSYGSLGRLLAEAPAEARLGCKNFPTLAGFATGRLMWFPALLLALFVGLSLGCQRAPKADQLSTAQAPSPPTPAQGLDRALAAKLIEQTPMMQRGAVYAEQYAIVKAEIMKRDPSRVFFPSEFEGAEKNRGCLRKLVSVDGIAMDPGDRTATIEFTWTLLPDRPEARCGFANLPPSLGGGPHADRVGARLYDNGWRLVAKTGDPLGGS